MQQLPFDFMMPPTSWRPPCEFRKFDDVVALDTETYDPRLIEKGPGFLYGEGYCVGIALHDSQGSMYLPFAHEGGDNLPKDTVVRYVQSILSSVKTVIMANATYDLGWLSTLGIVVAGDVEDVQVIEALIDEERSTYRLDALAFDYLGENKDERNLKIAANAYQIDPKGGLWKLPARYVGPYAEADARLTYQIREKQLPRIKALGLEQIWDIEKKITKISHKMSMKGVPVDLAAAEQLNHELQVKEDLLKKKFPFDIWATNQIAHYCKTQLKLTIPQTLKGNDSVDKAFMKHSNIPELNELLELRQINRLRKVFIEDGILQGHYRGRIHCEFMQTAKDDGGTRSGRFSCRNPNLQQVPKRSSIGKLIRALYTSESDHLWAKCDYSSQEPRLQVHYALLTNLPGATDARAAFIAGTKLYTFFEKETGLDYDTCKMLCLGIGYGMGKKKMAETLGVMEPECEQILHKFNTKAPFLRMLFENTMSVANRKGVIRTLLGRRCNFDWWSEGYGTTPIKGLAKAKAAYDDSPKLTRAFTSKALNRLIQGSAADQTKLAMVLCDEAGIDVRLPIHDEICANVPDEKTGFQMKEIMENAVKLELPVVADLEIGKTWK